MPRKNHNDVCRMENCYDEIKYPRLRLCSACYQWKWTHKTYYSVAEEMAYLDRVDRTVARCEELKRNAKVRKLPGKKTRAA